MGRGSFSPLIGDATRQQFSSPLFHRFFRSKRPGPQSKFSAVVVRFASCLICILREISKEFKELLRLADEESVVHKSGQGPHGSPVCLGWTNDRTYQEFAAEKRAWLRHQIVHTLVLRITDGHVIRRSFHHSGDVSSHDLGRDGLIVCAILGGEELSPKHIKSPE